MPAGPDDPEPGAGRHAAERAGPLPPDGHKRQGLQPAARYRAETLAPRLGGSVGDGNVHQLAGAAGREVHRESLVAHQVPCPPGLGSWEQPARQPVRHRAPPGTGPGWLEVQPVSTSRRLRRRRDLGTAVSPTSSGRSRGRSAEAHRCKLCCVRIHGG